MVCIPRAEYGAIGGQDSVEKLRTLELAWVDKIADDYNTLETELHKIADFIEPHWKGAGAKFEAEWIIAAIGKLCSERDDFERKNDALMAAVKALVVVYRISLRDHEAWRQAADALAAAGIQTEEKKEHWTTELARKCGHD